MEKSKHSTEKAHAPFPASQTEKLREALLSAADFYQKEGRMLPWRKDKEPYHVFLSEIMLQQTRVEAVIPYYTRFLSLYPTVRDLANADEISLFKAWEGLGYYSRARNLKRAAEAVVTQFGGIFPKDFEGLLTLPGVGGYTAGAIASICFGVPKSAIDGNALRIYARLFADGRSIADGAVKKEITALFDAVYPTGEQAGFVTQGLMEVGQRFCLPVGAPRCEDCPLRSYCAVGKGEDYRAYPHKEKKKARRIIPRTVLLCTKDGKFYIRRRSEKGLLHGLWEFPGVDAPLSLTEAVASAAKMGIIAPGAIECVEGKHIFTHIEWHMKGYLLPVDTCENDEFVLATPKELTDTYPIPSAFRVFLDFIKENKENK